MQVTFSPLHFVFEYANDNNKKAKKKKSQLCNIITKNAKKEKRTPAQEVGVGEESVTPHKYQ